jgi:hypothetical protein
MLLARQFEAEGLHVTAGECAESYVVAHVMLGRTITVTLAGPQGKREGIAVGMDDVSALYSQLVRALLSGRDVGSMIKVVDRTNVTVTQTSPRRVESDSVFYVRLGYGSQFSGGSQSGAATGFGMRHELDGFAIDVSVGNIQLQTGNDFTFGESGSSGSWIKLEALRYLNKHSNSSAYWGGGASWGSVRGSDDHRYWTGGGMQAELTAGYEMLRATNIRMFLQTDVVLPLYSATFETYRTYPLPSTFERRYVPTATVSLGLGWGHDRRRRP